ncbi:MAG: 3-phosphoshikimate 1-carboxyvinyltransferase, partial [Nitrospiraceae bacterium]|nr:3-phosphoshikimate 1-carboxyvinyltransferase [Nitrospiraceae bacterium]
MRAQVRLPGPRNGLRAAISVPPSKSLTNRALIAAAAAGGGEVISPLECDDTRLLASALARCGWTVRWPGVAGERSKDKQRTEQHALGIAHGTAGDAVLPPVTIGARTVPAGEVRLDLGNSGTGSRFLLALLAAVPGRCIVDGTARLRERPMGPLLTALGELGARVAPAPDGRLPATIAGRKLDGGEVRIAPGASSQFVSALMMMAPLTRRGLMIDVEGELPSRPYLD